MSKSYAVKAGRQTGIFATWSECQQQVNGFKGAIFKGFKSESEAEAWLNLGDCSNGDVKRKRESGTLDPEAGLKKPARERNLSHSSIAQASSEDSCPRDFGSLFFDGGSRGNPGRAGCGAVIFMQTGNVKKRMWSGGKYLGIQTNNVAEYNGLILGLKAAIRLGLTSLVIHGDSNLVINQVKGQWKCDKEHLKPLCEEAKELLSQLPNVTLQWVPRSDNSDADFLANQAMDESSTFSHDATDVAEQEQQPCLGQRKGIEVDDGDAERSEAECGGFGRAAHKCDEP